MSDTAKMGEALRSYATHHDHGEGWTYSRDLPGMRHIRYARDWEGWDSLGNRIKRAFSPVQLLGKDSLSRQIGFKFSFGSIRAHIKRRVRQLGIDRRSALPTPGGEQ